MLMVTIRTVLVLVVVGWV